MGGGVSGAGEALEVQNECRRGLSGMRVRSQSKCLVLM